MNIYVYDHIYSDPDASDLDGAWKPQMDLWHRTSFTCRTPRTPNPNP